MTATAAPRRRARPETPGPAPEAERLGALHAALADWFGREARDLPWRASDRTPWGVLVSEVMLQQTPVVRVLPVWREWMERWPRPADLAAEPAGEAVRAWGRLGYPRRALRLHAAATVITAEHGGELPDTEEELLALPGVGSYTAAAVAAFAFGRRSVVVDTNIRRVHARLVSGEALPAPSLTAAELRRAAALLPAHRAESVAWNAAAMELGALVCTARSPRCDVCPVAAECAWLAAGEPPPTYTPRGQAWHGTDRQVRGAIMAVLRAAEHPVVRELFVRAPELPDSEMLGSAGSEASGPCSTQHFAEAASPVGAALARLHALGTGPDQLERALTGLLADGLAVEVDGRLRLP
ncbi:adenine glycosylase [Sinomonas cyclohexanicum]|uniref:Adenine DNA glycosylase n=1 Tax=Sinomonas cyclohexanicum TaxID=322009 RepID=A0ABM7PQM3_SINCY|nr:A/G-specific adenine glycosylase [Corynebacterium cyclohexanicum]BCT74492.1 adenine glycosylase [Corynebacterium cyclohexanicum]